MMKSLFVETPPVLAADARVQAQVPRQAEVTVILVRRHPAVRAFTHMRENVSKRYVATRYRHRQRYLLGRDGLQGTPVRAATTSGVSTSCVDRSRHPTMICLPGSCASTVQSGFDCAALAQRAGACASTIATSACAAGDNAARLRMASSRRRRTSRPCRSMTLS